MGKNFKSYTNEQLEYFKNLIEGRAPISWRAWWNKNESILKNQLSSPEYARIKFGLVKYAYKILNANEINVKWDASSEKESYLANVDESCLDEFGRVKESVKKTLYNGAGGKFLNGENEQGKKILFQLISEVKNQPIMEAKELLESMEYEGEMMVDSGIEVEFGKALLEAVVSFGYGNDLADFAVSEAEKKLNA